MNNWQDFIKSQTKKIPIKRTRLIKTFGNARFFNSNSQQFLNFISNDYLGISTDKRVRDSLVRSSEKYGVGSTGAATLSGYSMEHELLTLELAKWLQFEKCLLFSSGYQLNVGVLTPLVNTDVHVWLDKNCHASHIDGVLLAKAKFTRFSDKDIDKLITTLQEQSNKRHIIISEGYFSMDGTNTYLDRLIETKRKFRDRVLLIIDDAHGIGALGTNGFGSLEEVTSNISLDIDLLIGTLGKTFGAHGGFVCGNYLMINYLQQTVRSQLYSTCLPPPLVAASLTTLNIINSKEGKKRRNTLVNNIRYFKQYFNKYSCSNIKLGNNEESKRSNNMLPFKLYNQIYNVSPVQLVVFNSTKEMSKVYQYLKINNILVGKIFYPTVPKESPRLRISLNSSHKKEDIHRLIDYIHKYYED